MKYFSRRIGRGLSCMVWHNILRSQQPGDKGNKQRKKGARRLSQEPAQIHDEEHHHDRAFTRRLQPSHDPVEAIAPFALDRIPHPFILTRNALLLAQLLLILCDIRQGPAELRA